VHTGGGLLVVTSMVPTENTPAARNIGPSESGCKAATSTMASLYRGEGVKS
jgi:hypothetical protein